MSLNNKKNKLDEKHQIVVILPDGFKIKVNYYNWILTYPSGKPSYHSDLNHLLQDLFDYQVKSLALQSEQTTLQALANAINQAKKYINEIMHDLVTIKVPDSTDIRSQERDESEVNE